MNPEYDIQVDPARNLVRLTITGFMDFGTVQRFAADPILAMKRLRCGKNEHVTLCDVSQQMVSPPEAADAFKLMIADSRFSARRIAFVVDNALARIQTQRVARRDRVGYFRDIASAEAWLLEPEPHMTGAEAAVA